MRNPETILNSLSAHSEDVHYKYERLYRILFNEQMYYVAYQRIYAKPGNMTPGSDGKTIDGMSIERIGNLINSLRDESFMPTPAKRVYIPKKNGKKRPLGIPSIEDKIVQEVVRMILEAIYEGHFENTSHGFRPKRSCHTALHSIKNLFTGAKWFIEGDIKGFFDNIDHHVLIDTLKERISDDRFLRLMAVRMDYGVAGSGTQDSYIATALPRNFGYSASTVKYVQRKSYTDAQWDDLVYGELAAGRAVCLSGQDLKNGYGHCFNLDGYDNGAYHVNWGWGGANNGYFELSALKDPTMNMDYSAPAYQSLIIGIQKPTSTVVVEGPQDITLSETSVASDAAVGTVVGNVSVVFDTGLAPEYGLKVSGTKYNAITHRYNKVPFGITDGQLVTTDAIPTDKTSIDIKITATDEYGYKLDKTFTITITAPTAISTIGSDSDAIVSTTYYNIEGQRVDKAQHGTYIVVYTLKSGKKRTAKIVKQ